MAKGLKELASVQKPQISTTLAKQIVNFGTAVQIIKGIDFASLTQLSAGLNALASVKNPEISPAVARHIEAIGNSVLTLKDIDFSIMPALADSLRSLDGIQNSNLGNIINQLKKVPEIATNIANSGISTFAENIRQLVEALAPLGTIGKSNLNSVLNQLKKIPEITEQLHSEKIAEFAAKIREVTEAVRPLATEMEKVSRGFSALPTQIQKVINANARLKTSNTKTAFSFNMLAMRFGILLAAATRIARVMGKWIDKSSQYVEDLNLFTVAMGKYADESKRYAQKHF